MNKKVAFSNIDVDVMQQKLRVLDDMGERISYLSNLLDNGSLANIKPAGFLNVSSAVSKAYSELNGRPLKEGILESELVKTIAEKGSSFSRINTKFLVDAVDIIKEIKNLRDQIEWADRDSKAKSIIKDEHVEDRQEEDNYIEENLNEYGDGSDGKHFKLDKDVTLPLPNGEKIKLSANTYDVIDVKYDEDGKAVAVAIMKDGKKIWIYIDQNGNILKYVVETEGILYKVNSTLTFILPNGEMAVIPPGFYNVLRSIYDSAGQLVQMVLLVDGKEILVEIQDGEIVGVVSISNSKFEVKKDIEIVLLNGKKISIRKGFYEIIDAVYNEDGSLKSVCIEVDGYKIWLYLDANGNVIKYVVIINGEEYTINTSITFQDSQGKNQLITPGVYKIIEYIYDANGNLIGIAILVDGQKITLDVKNGEIIGVVSAEDYYYNVKESILLKLPNGNTLHIIPGKYRIYDATYDENGNLKAICIEVDGHKVWLYFNKNGNIIQVKVIINNGKFTLDMDYDYTDSNGNLVKISRGVYALLETIYDANGNLIQAVILVDGKRVIINIQNGTVLGIIHIEPAIINIKTTMYAYAADGTLLEITPGEYEIVQYLYDKYGNVIGVIIKVGGKLVTLRYFNGELVGIKIKPENYFLKTSVTITLPDGTSLTIPEGNYKIIDVIYNKDGVVTAVCIEYSGCKIWLYLDNDGSIVKVEYIKITPGVFKIVSPDLVVKDKYGNILDGILPGKYYVYEVRYDKDGKIIAVRISPDGEEEKWVYLSSDSTKDELALFEQQVQENGGMLSMLKKNKALIGILGVLSVAAGSAMIIKKRHKKKKESFEEDDWEDVDVKLEEGNYAVYEVQKDAQDNVKSVRITPDNANDEYWIEM